MRPPAELPILFESAHEWVVIKPAGMPTELTSDPRGVSLIERIRRSGHPDARLPHRLDRMTRGLVVIALTAESIAFHNEQIRAGAWAKWYLARVLAERDPSELLGSHRAYLRTMGDRAQVVRAGGKPALLDVLGHTPAPGRTGQAHLAIRLHTGRFHQIRAMLAHQGFPIAGDTKYAGEMRSVSNPKYGGETRSRDVRYGGERAPGDAPYLEHAALRLRPYGETTARVFFKENDPERERIDPTLLQLLSRHIAAIHDEESA